MPPGQCASVPGFSVQPQTPTVGAPAMSTSRSVPAAEVTVMRFAPRSMLRGGAHARLQRGDRAPCARALPGARSRSPGCARRLSGSPASPAHASGPRCVQSTTKPAWPSAPTTGASSPIASLAPVERTGTGCRLRGVGTTIWNGRAPRRSSASSASCTLSCARLRLREDRGGVAALDRARLEHLAEGVDPFSFDAVGEHQSSSGNPCSSQRAQRIEAPR